METIRTKKLIMKKEVKVSFLSKKLIVRLGQSLVHLPNDIQEKIDAYWQELLKNGKKYKRGEVFTVTKKDETDKTVEVLVEKTDYAHYLYCQNVDNLGDYGVHIIHTAILVETSDGKIIFGKMGEHTSRAGIFQLCGGGIDNHDLRGDVFDFDHNISKESMEELGMDIADKKRIKNFRQAYFKDGGPTDKMTVVYSVELTETSSEFMEKYAKYAESLICSGENPEFGEIIILAKNKTDIREFFTKNIEKCDEYMNPLFEFIVENESVN
ncbi:MAG: hypothetical protein ACD_9C00231G0001 [uncultured bacterium]|nr:MAG: hypothetical protein ACD_9C00231G0001 [uncultured bacterium]